MIRSQTFKESYYEDLKLFQTIWIRFFMILFLTALASLPWWGNPYLIYLVNLSCIAVVAAIGLNSDRLYRTDLHVPCGLCRHRRLSTAFFPPRPVGPSGSAVGQRRPVGPDRLRIGIPCLRLKGLYLAMATMSFGVVVEFVVITWEKLTGGVRGLSVARVRILGYPLDSDTKIYYFLLVLTVCCSGRQKPRPHPYRSRLYRHS